MGNLKSVAITTNAKYSIIAVLVLLYCIAAYTINPIYQYLLYYYTIVYLLYYTYYTIKII